MSGNTDPVARRLRSVVATKVMSVFHNPQSTLHNRLFYFGMVRRFAFLTATPLNIARGSGTYSGISSLATGLRVLGHEVEILAPSFHLPVYTLERLLFNERLRRTRFDGFDTIVGFDMDGWRLALPHVAAIKGVIADEMRFEQGLTCWTMAIQARCERTHVVRAAHVITTSEYAAARILALYGRKAKIVPECIDLAEWRAALDSNKALPDPARFTVLCVCRFYPRKRVDVLLRAAARLPQVQVRIVGGGPAEKRLRTLARELRLEGRVRWLGTVGRDALAREYTACDAFCLPSVQEGFGIVFLEAMAAGKPIVAARAAAAPEVIRDGLLVDPDNHEALAAAIENLARDPDLRRSLAEAGPRNVECYDAPRVARLFLETI